MTFWMEQLHESKLVTCGLRASRSMTSAPCDNSIPVSEMLHQLGLMRCSNQLTPDVSHRQPHLGCQSYPLLPDGCWTGYPGHDEETLPDQYIIIYPTSKKILNQPGSTLHNLLLWHLAVKTPMKLWFIYAAHRLARYNFPSLHLNSGESTPRKAVEGDYRTSGTGTLQVVTLQFHQTSPTLGALHGTPPTGYPVPASYTTGSWLARHWIAVMWVLPAIAMII